MNTNFPKIAVVGGTNFDSGRGAEMLRSLGVPCDSIGLSDDPDTQSEMYLHPEILEAHFHEKVGKLAYKHIVVFCNSLSFAGPWKNIYGKRMTELTAVYTQLLQRVNLPKTAIIVAEENMKNQLEKLAVETGICAAIDLHIFPNLDFIKQLEASGENQQRQLILAEIKRLQNLGFTEIIFGCTHLDHPDFYHLADVKIHQPGLEMLADFVKNL